MNHPRCARSTRLHTTRLTMLLVAPKAGAHVSLWQWFMQHVYSFPNAVFAPSAKWSSPPEKPPRQAAAVAPFVFVSRSGCFSSRLSRMAACCRHRHSPAMFAHTPLRVYRHRFFSAIIGVALRCYRVPKPKSRLYEGDFDHGRRRRIGRGRRVTVGPTVNLQAWGSGNGGARKPGGTRSGP